MSIDHDLSAGPAAVLDGRAPDAELVATLDDIDPTALTGEALASYVRARWRVHNHAEAQLLAGLRELGTAREGRTVRLASSDEFSGDEVAALLGWSRTMAARRLDLADDLAERLPAVGAAMWQGLLDEPKVRAISELTGDLCDDHARFAAAEVLPEAPELPVAALRERLEQIALDLDPDWAERRRRRAEARGRVLLSANPSGTATLALVDAPATEGIASMARIEALAAAVRRLGVLVPISQLRMQVGMRLLNGSTAGMTDEAIAALLAAEYHATGSPEGAPDDGPGEQGPVDPRSAPDDSDGPDDEGSDGTDGEPDEGPDDGSPGGGPGSDEPDDAPLDGPGGGGDAGDDQPSGATDDDYRGHSTSDALSDGASPTLSPPRSSADHNALALASAPDRPEDNESPGSGPPESRAGQVRQGTVEVRLRLTTALGLDQHPATVPGYGAITAPVARELVARHHDGEWRVVLTDPDGHLQHVLLARRRPSRPRGRDRARGRAPGATRTGAIVEIQVPTAVLAALEPDDHGDWAPLLHELRQRLRDLVAHGHLGRPPDADSGPDQWVRRRPGAEAERWVRVRDRHCVAPACRQHAHRAEIDHTRGHASGGPTVTWNLGAWCTHHHRLKHLGGWRVRQPSPGWFVVRTRAGVTHTTRPPRVLEPLPGPRPAVEPRPLPDDGWHDEAQTQDAEPGQMPDDGSLGLARQDDAQPHDALDLEQQPSTPAPSARPAPTSPKTTPVPDPDDDAPPF
ncbi:DUF222 domain-containing protein [Actinomycetospora straminea]|uniref:DUF222 domain-containing protein n=1 Tax=Actinomycetospora straminea TaxID=663607 RepID=A0ABP9F4K7_9PSEU|nr:DUF222 domain-containing protein [Actinomycetospora straminea]MDD7931627.1 DUF222 domain-containing protein [Actinomycetospora straminea]